MEDCIIALSALCDSPRTARYILDMLQHRRTDPLSLLQRCFAGLMAWDGKSPLFVSDPTLVDEIKQVLAVPIPVPIDH